MPRRKKIDEFQRTYVKFKIVCNNTVNGGDCYGETFCQPECGHKEIWCLTHRVMICTCCYPECPSCVLSKDAHAVIRRTTWL